MLTSYTAVRQLQLQLQLQRHEDQHHQCLGHRLPDQGYHCDLVSYRDLYLLSQAHNQHHHQLQRQHWLHHHQREAIPYSLYHSYHLYHSRRHRHSDLRPHWKRQHQLSHHLDDGFHASPHRRRCPYGRRCCPRPSGRSPGSVKRVVVSRVFFWIGLADERGFTSTS